MGLSDGRPLKSHACNFAAQPLKIISKSQRAACAHLFGASLVA